MTVPDGAQLSEDGKYWWDGADWQPVPEDGGGSTEVGQLSDDGKWKWDGSEWQPVDEGDGTGTDAADGTDAGAGDGTGTGDGTGEGGGDLAGALAEQGIEISADAADPGYIQQMYDHLNNFYNELDDKGQAIVDSLARNGADTILADPEVGLVAQDDPLIAAFANNDKTLGESLQATGEALQQVQG
ncbi:hypothetical protein [Actinophytocola sp.]|uniref:hypothetical protein n=1 Tax=Actinophytocola sp. TaxID=1872138 RepID=UPI00389AE350